MSALMAPFNPATPMTRATWFGAGSGRQNTNKPSAPTVAALSKSVATKTPRRECRSAVFDLTGRYDPGGLHATFLNIL